MRFVISAMLMLCLCSIVLVQGVPAQTRENPTQFYVRYRAAVQSATSMEQVLEFWSDDLAKSYTSAPPAERVGLDELKKVYAMHTDVRVVMVQGSVSGGIGPPRWSTATATLSLEGLTVDEVRVVGTARLIERDGAWKVVGPEEWQGQ
jgi:hypothetical protein